MTSSPSTYCVLEQFGDPDCWNITSETYGDFNSLLERLEQIWSQHHRNSEIGISVILRNSFQGQLQVGISHAGWLLIMRNKDDQTRILHGDQEGKELTQFLLPELTDFERHYLIAEPVAKSLIRQWLDDGTIPTIS